MAGPTAVNLYCPICDRSVQVPCDPQTVQPASEDELVTMAAVYGTLHEIASHLHDLIDETGGAA